MRVAIVLPRNMYFGPRYATAIDLCVKEFVEHSSFKATTRVFGGEVDESFEGFDFVPIKRKGRGVNFAQLVEEVRAFKEDIIVVQQHVHTGLRLFNAFPSSTFVLHKHSVPKLRVSQIARWWESHHLKKFGKILFVSSFDRDALLARSPSLKDNTAVLNNGTNSNWWNSAKQKEKVVLFVGRAVQEKGALEAAKSVSDVLEKRQDWRAVFILSRLGAQDSYLKKIESALATVDPDRLRIKFDVPFSDVVEAYKHAAIALVPSVFSEPFGRTALEAMASGCTLITSMRGGLREVAEGVGIEIDPQSPKSIAEAMEELIDSPERRNQLAIKGRSRVKAHFDIQKKSDELDAIYRNLRALKANKNKKKLCSQGVE